MSHLFELILTNKARKQFKKLDTAMRGRVEELFNVLQLKPVPAEEYDLKKIAGELDTYRVRLSSFRVIYRVYWANKVVGVAKIERRSETTYL